MSLLLIGWFAGFNIGFARAEYPGKTAGPVPVKSATGYVVLQNRFVAISFAAENGTLEITGFSDKKNRAQMALGNSPLFSLVVGKKVITSRDFNLINPMVESIVAGDPAATRLADRLPGKKLTADLEDKNVGLQVHLEAILLNDAGYVRQVFTFSTHDSVKIDRLILVQLPATKGVHTEGTVDGSPVVYRNMFFALEHPMSQSLVGEGGVSIYLPRSGALYASVPLMVSSVWGTTPAGQMRRGFQRYVEFERAVPFRQMLHYNSWFDISWGDRKLNEALCLDRIKTFKDSLIDKRHVKLKAFLFDDGWDDDKTLWQFNAGFPKGFTQLAEAAKKANSTLGVWISPWGGYDEAKTQRLNYGKKQTPPFEINENGFSLTGPNYYRRFTAVTSSFIKNYNISMFKFDGVGAGNGAGGASISYQKDIEAFLKLITGLRSEKPGLYLSLTVGTWPSVYWLKFGDAIWRAGEDTGLAGEGGKRQQWITYKDGQAYKNVVKRAPLYPLNSVMYHGVCIAANGLPGTLEMDNKAISDEIWAFFGSGTGLQELYINPHELNTANWDCLREAANWSEAHAGQLADSHWVGGDPSKKEVYGFAGWANKKAVLTLRNPSAKACVFTVNVKQVLEIPDGDSDRYVFEDAKTKLHKQLYQGKTFVVKLAPFEVKVMDAKPL